MAFIDQRLPTKIEVNAVKRDDEDIEIVTSDGGGEVRNARASQSLREFDIAFPAAKYGDEIHDAVIALYKVARKSLHTWRFRDFTDYQLDGEVIGEGDGATTTFQIIQSWHAGGVSESRWITRPASPMQVFKDGVLQGSGYTVDYGTGVITFTSAPADGAEIAVTGEFDIPTRFDSVQTTTAINRGLKHLDTLTVQEVHEA